MESNHTAPQPAGTQGRVWCADYTSVLKKRQRDAYFLGAAFFAVFFAAVFFLGDFLAALGLAGDFALGAAFLTAVAAFLGEAFFLGGMPPKPIYAYTAREGGWAGGRARWSFSRGRGRWAQRWPADHGRRGGNNADPT